MARDSIKHTLKVAVLLCLVCSLLVSASAVGLRSLQEQNKRLEQQKNILIAAGLFNPDEHGNQDVKAMFEKVTPRILDLETGEYLTADEVKNVLGIDGEENYAQYDQKQAVNNPDLSDTVPASDDKASIKRREKYSLIYEVKDGEALKQLVLPIRGYGLWSTLWGYAAIDAQSLQEGPEQITVTGLKYYDQKETPGLGGEVDNPSWLAHWPGKHIYDADWNVKIAVAKGGAGGAYGVDALSGATITSNGVTNMLEYWFGKNGFRPFLEKQSQE